jgi:ribosomal protein S27AE
MNFSEALRKLGMRPAGGNHATLRRYAEQVWNISTAHFDPHAAQRDALRRANQPRPIEEFLVEGSLCCRSSLKRRLLREGLKQPICEMCGQGEIWKGRRMSLILDHINGVANDNRIENLRMVCPNCAATLDTHCAKKLRLPARECARCGELFQPNQSKRRYCSSSCGSRWDRSHLRGARPDMRKVERPPYEQLLAEVQAMGYSAVGRKYGVSDNAIRKWVRAYEAELGRAA